MLEGVQGASEVEASVVDGPPEIAGNGEPEPRCPEAKRRQIQLLARHHLVVLDHLVAQRHFGDLELAQVDGHLTEPARGPRAEDLEIDGLHGLGVVVHVLALHLDEVVLHVEAPHHVGLALVQQHGAHVGLPVGLPRVHRLEKHTVAGDAVGIARDVVEADGLHGPSAARIDPAVGRFFHEALRGQLAEHVADVRRREDVFAAGVKGNSATAHSNCPERM